MRAISQDVLGGPEVLKEVEVPAARRRARARSSSACTPPASTRPTGSTARPAASSGEPPFVLGWDVSGVVEAVGIGVTAFKPGDEVFGMLPYPARGRLPRRVRHRARPAPSPASPPASTTSRPARCRWPRSPPGRRWSTPPDVRPGQRVLIHAAAGGVGHLAVQIAKARGAYVIGTASAGKHDFVRALGADEVIDYRRRTSPRPSSDVDVVLDPIGGDHAAAPCAPCARRQLVSILPAAGTTGAEPSASASAPRSCSSRPTTPA